MSRVSSCKNSKKNIIERIICEAFTVLPYTVLIFVFLSLMVSGEGSGIRLYRFLSIAFSSTLFIDHGTVSVLRPVYF